ncbi:MAG: phosphotransferase [Patescibacteria group bacterium]|nr:phosphotransferase [Patescibacteria group bacterium]
MNNFFAQDNIKKALNEILENNGLNVLYNMSNSCDFVVKQCEGKCDKRYILKIRKRNNDFLKQQFINEIFINIFLEKKFPDKFPYKIIDYNIEDEPEFLLYKMIKARPLNGYYFLIGARNKKKYNPKEIVDLICLLQKQTDVFQKENLNVKLQSSGYENSLNSFLKYKKINEQYLNNKDIFSTQSIIEKNRNLLDKNLVLSHGDLNPKNILIKDDKKTTFIDWTGVELNNYLSDFVRFYFSNWNVKEKQQLLKKEIFKKFGNDETLFNLNILILTGDFLRILNDSSNGLNSDFQKNIINKDTKEKMIDKIKQAEISSIKQFKKSLKYFNNYD